MNSAARSTRARRGRLMIVGEIAELSGILQHLHAHGVTAIRSRNLFEAMGELAVSTSSAPIASVVMTDRGANTISIRAIEAMRKIDPSVRIVVIADSDQSKRPSPINWSAAGIDDCIESPILPADLARVFDEDSLAPGVSLDELAKLLQPAAKATTTPVEPDPHGARMQHHAPPSRRQHVHELTEEMSPPATVTPPPPASRPSPDVRSPAPASSPAPADAHGMDETLGDTDLVDAVLAGAGRVNAVALRLIVQQTNWTDLALSIEKQDDAPDQTNDGRDESDSSAVIELQGRRYGSLQSTIAGPDQLQPWADWLARWLALDHAYHDHRAKANLDDLTGAGNRRFFDAFLNDSIQRAGKARRPVTLMVFDIDNFKSFNDQFGHDAGDDILRETVRLMQSVIRQGDCVCRIGGDEFAVIFADPEAPREPGSRHPETIEVIATRFQDQICTMRFPKLGAEAPGTLSISAGLATYPWDGSDPATLLRHADQLALESKRKGKNIITFGPGAAQACKHHDHH